MLLGDRKLGRRSVGRSGDRLERTRGTMASTNAAALTAKSTTSDTPRGVAELSADILRKTTSLFLSGPRPHAAEQLDLFDQIFARLMPQVNAEALGELSAALATVERAPSATARLLASHGDIRVAAPILAKASVLTDRDLAEFIKAS